MEAILTPSIDDTTFTSIFNDTDLFTKYRVTIQFIDKVMGGVPQKPEIIEGWLRKKMLGNDDAELRQMMLNTLDELGMEVEAEMTMEQLYEVARHAAAKHAGNTFYRDEHGLYLKGHQPKAMLKEAVNILFAGERWGKTNKGPKNFLAERVFVDELRIYLGRDEPDGTDLQIGHVSGPQGPRSTLTYVDYCRRPSVSFTVSSLNDCIKPEQWKKMLILCQKSGLGALRSMGNGQFVMKQFDKL